MTVAQEITLAEKKQTIKYFEDAALKQEAMVKSTMGISREVFARMLVNALVRHHN